MELVTAMPEIGDDENRGKFLKVADDSDELIFDNLPSELPAIGTDQHRGEYLKVDDNSDSLVWDSPAVPEISRYNGDVSVVNATNDVSSGGYVFDVNLDSDTLEKRSTQGAHQVSYIAVKNPVPPITDASDGDVLTYKDSDGIVWAPAQGGGGGTTGIVANADVSSWRHNGDVPTDYSNCGAASLIPIYTVTGTTARIEWLWKFAPNDSAGWTGATQSGSFEL